MLWDGAATVGFLHHNKNPYFIKRGLTQFINALMEPFSDLKALFQISGFKCTVYISLQDNESVL